MNSILPEHKTEVGRCCKDTQIIFGHLVIITIY